MFPENINSVFYNKKILKIKLIQYFFRKVLQKQNLKKNFSEKNKYIQSFLSKINEHCYNRLKRKELNKEEYDYYMMIMESSLTDFVKTMFNLKNEKLSSLHKVFFKKYTKKILEIKYELLNLCNGIGSPSIIDFLCLYFEIDVQNSHQILFENINIKYFELYNNTFIPSGVSVYINNKDSLRSVLNNNQSKKLISFNDKSKDDIKTLLGLTESVQLEKDINNNVKMYLIFEKSQQKIFISLKGTIKYDNLNIYHNHPLIKENIESLKNTICESDNSFYESYINQLPLEDFVINDIFYLKNKIMNSSNKLKILKQKNISSLIKDFLNSDFDEQKETITLLLINNNDNETEYLAYLLYDILGTSDDNKNKRENEEIFNSLHWSIQKKFKVVINKIKKKNDNLIDFNEEQISYEQRIMLMKIDDYVKQKAMEKYKEVSSKSSADGSNKAQQYLDGVLRIPFGVYKKEKIIEYLENYSKRIEIFYLTLKKMRIDKKDTILNELISNLQINKFTIQSIDLFLNNHSINYFQKDYRYKIEKVYDFIDKTTIKNIKYLIKMIKQKDLLPKCKLTFKITENNKMIKSELIRTKIKDYFSQIIKLTLTDECPESVCHDILSILNIDYYYTIKNNNENKNMFQKYVELKQDWISFKNNKITFLDNVSMYLDNAVYGHDEAKNQIKRIIAQWITGENTGYSFGFEGPPGTGKTSIAKKGLTKCLTDDNGKSRPFSFIAMGGSTNGSTLEGHSYTYVGSTWGRIVDILMESKCMNPIIFIDELDKISKTEHGKELIGILTHLTDSTQNQEFTDKYFSGIKIDLSKVLFIFSYNNPENIDPILLDRIHRIKFKSLKKQEKIYICRNYMIPEICKIVGFENENIIFENELIEKIIEQYTYEPGVRKLRERLMEIVREINLRYLTGGKFNGEKVHLPFKVQIEHLESDIFSQKIKMKTKKINNQPKIGLVNGLYATASGLGGITIIEAYKINSSNFLSLELTGQQGDVMKESMKVAKTVAWNTIIQQSKIKKEAEINGNGGIHIHCPEGATPKDGPSAGLAITTALISLLTQIPVNNKVGMTGEIDLNGSSHEIGGLESKLYGAKKAGVEHVLIPRDNENDYLLIKNDPINEGLFENFKITLVDSIWDVLRYALVNPENKQFINYTQSQKSVLKRMIYSDKICLEIENIPNNYSKKSIQWEQLSGPNMSHINQPTEEKTLIDKLIPGTYVFNVNVDYQLKNNSQQMVSSGCLGKNQMEKPLIIDDFLFKTQVIIENLREPFVDTNSSYVTHQNSFELKLNNLIYDPEKITNIEWSILESPQNSEAKIEDTLQISTQVNNLSLGEYLFQLKIIDNNKKIYTSEIKLEVESEYQPIIRIS